MCGRYYSLFDKQHAAEHFHVRRIDDRGCDPRPALDVLHPYDASKMKMTPANPAIWNWRNNGPEILDGPK
jgi:hypothetical protein